MVIPQMEQPLTIHCWVEAVGICAGHENIRSLTLAASGKGLSRMTLLLEELAGWVGAAILLAAYGLVSFKKLRPDSLWNHSLNGAGSGLLIVDTVYHRAFPSAFVNVIWILIAVVAQMRSIFAAKNL